MYWAGCGAGTQPLCPLPRPVDAPAVPVRCLQGGSVTARRRLVCAHLGLGECDGKQLGRQLNRYCFSREEVEAALAWAERQLQREQQAGQQQQPARNAHSNLDTRQPKTD